MKYAIIDIDGTISDCSVRLYHAKLARAALSDESRQRHWDRFHEAHCDDPPHRAEVELVRAWVYACNVAIYLTGRPERLRESTKEWIMRNGLPVQSHYLLMRPEVTSALRTHEWKEFVYQTVIRPAHGPATFVLEDKDECVAMWRRNGLTCLQPRTSAY